MTELLAEFSPSAYMTDIQLSRVTRIPELATQARSTMSPTLLRDRALVQTQVAEAEAILSAARAYVLTSVGAAWEAVSPSTAPRQGASSALWTWG